MKQLLQSLRDGSLELVDVPPPVLRPEGVLVRTNFSVISVGTERMLARLARKSLFGKARERPDLVKKVWQKFRREGLTATWRAVWQKLDRLVPLGYSCVGEVLKVGEKALGFQPGMLVACAGAGYASHAEINYVPGLLASPVPDGVCPEAAAYATVGAIALHGIRNADCRVGETVAVLGLGLLGQLSVQLLKAAGCWVVGLDPDGQRVELARQNGVDLAWELSQPETAVNACRSATRGRGVDAVLITAATASNAPVELAAEIARDRARVVMVGVTGMEIPRKAYYEKELTFVVSRSYGPGRYDPQFEEHGHDYPIGYVRWTQTRNLEAFLQLAAQGRIHPERLTTHRFPFERAEAAMELILRGKEPYLGVLLEYPREAAPPLGRVELPEVSKRRATVGSVGVSFVGAGDFARSTLLPILRKFPQVQFRGIVTASGVSARDVGSKFGFAWCASSVEELLSDTETDILFIATRHSQHAEMVCRALSAGKAVFCEKPLAISLNQLQEIEQALQQPNRGLMVGFNRRFSPFARRLKQFFAARKPLVMTYRVNAGSLSPDHWLADPAEGGRIIGEACHFIDLFHFLTDAPATTVDRLSAEGVRPQDDGQFLLRYADGSTAHLVYTTQGAAAFGKERLEVHGGGASAVLEDFRVLELMPPTGRRERLRSATDKGHTEELREFIEAVRTGGPMPIPPESLIEVTRTTLAAAGALEEIPSRDIS